MMNDYWHIPRASLASSSNASLASSSNRSNGSTNSNPPTMRSMNKNFTINTGVGAQEIHKHYNNKNFNFNNNNKTNPPRIHKHELKNEKSKDNIGIGSGSGGGGGGGGGKRGSRSSQGSNNSNHSTRSTASSSLLLTAANLERFAEIHKKQEKLNNIANNKIYLNEEPTTIHHQLTTNRLGENLMQALATTRYQQQQQQQHQQQQQQINNNKQYEMKNNTDDATIIQMDPNLDFVKTKDLDSVSIASSMHFTMVNGESGSSKKQKRGLCDRGRQVTVLIISMSTVFLFLIMGMVYALEMRAREMPQS